MAPCRSCSFFFAIGACFGHWSFVLKTLLWRVVHHIRMVLWFCCSFCWGRRVVFLFVCWKIEESSDALVFCGEKQEPVKSKPRRGDLAGYRAAQEPTVRVSGWLGEVYNFLHPPEILCIWLYSYLHLCFLILIWFDPSCHDVTQFFSTILFTLSRHILDLACWLVYLCANDLLVQGSQAEQAHRPNPRWDWGLCLLKIFVCP